MARGNTRPGSVADAARCPRAPEPQLRAIAEELCGLWHMLQCVVKLAHTARSPRCGERSVGRGVDPDVWSTTRYTSDGGAVTATLRGAVAAIVSPSHAAGIRWQPALIWLGVRRLAWAASTRCAARSSLTPAEGADDRLTVLPTWRGEWADRGLWAAQATLSLAAGPDRPIASSPRPRSPSA